MNQELRKKLGQLLMVGFHGLEPDAHIRRMIEQNKVGGIILFRRNVQSPKQVANLCRKLQEINAQVSDIPLLIALDQEGGMVQRIEEGVTPMPSAMAFQAAGSMDDCEQLHHISATEMRSLGINMILAPVLDVNNNPTNPVIGVRAFGEDTDTVIRYGMAALKGLQSAGVVTTAKHFPGHGDTSTDSHIAMPIIAHDLERLNSIELPPFKAAIDQGVHAIMTAHVIFPAIEKEENCPATMSKAVLTDLLRDKLGFQGVIISDCLEMAAIVDGVGVADGAVKTLQAGADMALISHQETRQQAAIDAIFHAVSNGSLSDEHINASFDRIQQLKKCDAVAHWKNLLSEPVGLMQATSQALANKVQRAALVVPNPFRPLNHELPVVLITVEVRQRSEIDEVAGVGNKEARCTLLPYLVEKGVKVQEIALSCAATEQEIEAAVHFAHDAPQIVVQTYNATLFTGQQRLLASLPQDKLWIVAGRLPYDLDLAPKAQGRIAGYSCQPSALALIAEKIMG